VDELIARAKRSGVRQMTRTMAFGIYDHNLVCARETLHRRCARLAGACFASGCGRFARAPSSPRRRAGTPDAVPEQRCPGVMLAGAADKYAMRSALPAASES